MIISKVAAATASAVVVVGTLFAVGAINRISSADASGDEVLAYAYLGGSVGPYRYFGPNEKNYNYDIAALDVKVAEINGDAQYETCWNLGEGALSIDYLALAVVKGENDSVPTRDNYPDLRIVVDEVYIDGEACEFENSEDAYDYNYLEADDGGGSRAFLATNWGINDDNDLGIPHRTEVLHQILVRFTISGLGCEGTSNIAREAIETQLGDLDDDGIIDASDASAVLVEYAAVQTGAAPSVDKSVGDVNGDDFIDASDASSILQYFAYTQTGGSDSIQDFLSK